MDERNVHPSLNDLISDGNRAKGMERRNDAPSRDDFISAKSRTKVMEGRFASPSIEEVQHERKVFSVYAAALRCGLCRGLPRSVCRDGACGWYSIFCRRWYLRLVCTKVDAGGKEIKSLPSCSVDTKNVS